MKKKAIKIAASTAVAATAFVAAAPVQQADAATNVNQLATDAQNAGTVLKWAISKEGSADFKTVPTAQYNAAKKAVAAAEKAAEKLSSTEKLSVQAKLVEPKIQINRAMAYIDALTSSTKIVALTDSLNTAIKSGDLGKVETAYHTASEEYRKQVILLDRVYGQSTRDEIRNQVKPAIEKLMNDVKYDVTVKMHADKAAAFTKEGKIAEAAAELNKAEYNLTLKEAKFSFKKDVQKLYDDALTALPLTALSVTSASADGKTVVVKLSKAPGAVANFAASQFVFVGGNDRITATTATLNADGKSVTLTLAGLQNNKEYTLHYNGAATTAKYQVTAAADTSFVSAQTDDAHYLNGKARSYSVKMTNADGTPFTGQVTINLGTVSANTFISSAELVSVNAATATTFVGVDGVLDFVVTNNGAIFETAKPTVTYVTNTGSTVTKELGDVSFYPEATDGATASITADADSFYDATQKILFHDKKAYIVKSGDLFQVNGVGATEAQFAKAFSYNDTFVINYYTKSISSFNITNDVTFAGITVANSGLSYEGSTFTFKGKAQPGYTVQVYPVGNRTNKLGEAKVNADGTYQVAVRNVTNGTNNFDVVQVAPNGAVPGTTAVATDNVAKATAYVGTFGLNSVSVIDSATATTSADSFLNAGDVLVLNTTHDALYDVLLSTTGNANIVIAGGGKTATLTVTKATALNTANNTAAPADLTNAVLITGISYADQVLGAPIFNLANSNYRAINSVNGVTNQDGLVLKQSINGQVVSF
ncbi:hypothetical protein [Psychrobacillus sp. FSL K6-1415]|uniref:hypothetical protein n=1 Tax=Psychrobacillus sp. FSL K6-1415 TaxID=2921544 RepID=UPI0030FBB255